MNLYTLYKMDRDVRENEKYQQGEGARDMMWI